MREIRSSDFEDTATIKSARSARPIEILLGAECLETWGIGLDMKNKQLDFVHYQKEAVER
jgi:hypothetical protein